MLTFAQFIEEAITESREIKSVSISKSGGATQVRKGKNKKSNT